MSSNPLLLRPHHGLCLRFFTGHGYDQRFTQHTASVLRQLRENPQIMLTEGHDTLCSVCPHRTAACPNAAVYDRQVLSLCHLAYGQTLPWQQWQAQIETGILAVGHWPAICSTCPWYALCQSAQAALSR